MARSRDRLPETARAWLAMGTLIEIRVPDLPAAEAIEAIRRVRTRVEQLETAMTLFRPESPLVMFNASPEDAWMNVPRDLVEAVDASLGAWRGTEGAFDPSVAPAMKAWGLYDLNGSHPTRNFLRSWKARPKADAVDVDLANHRLRRRDKRVELDLGGIGKGIAVDAALAELRIAGSRAALVNFGGEIGALGAPDDVPDGWPVGIAHPRKPGEFCAEFSLKSGHIATSGDYERWVETSSGRKHHILDPATGEPAPRVASVTVWRASGVEADIASTAGFVQVSRGVRVQAPEYVVREQHGEMFLDGTLNVLAKSGT
jgi:FAD:protein FMN transferase